MRRLLCGLTLAALPLFTHAARPLATDDAGVLARGDCEWELVGTRPGGGGDGRGWNTLGTCGAPGALQLLAGIGRVTSGGGHATTSFLGLKTGLVDGGEDGTALTVSAGLNALREPGLGQRLDSTAVTLIATRPLGGRLTAHANLGWLRSRGPSESTTAWNLAIEHGGPASIDLAAEVYGDDRSNAPWLAAGLRWNIAPNFNLNASWGRQGGSTPQRLFTVGFKLSF